MVAARIWRNLITPPWVVSRYFSAKAILAIEKAIRDSEAQHAGQICFAVEATLDLRPLLAGQTARERAIEVFSLLRVWDTEENNGVLIYLLLAERDVEIIADRGIAGRLEAQRWEAICQEMEAHFRAGRFARGAVAGVTAVGEALARHYPHTGGSRRNEIPDRPVIL
jgi:uncharacterized membrane protein